MRVDPKADTEIIVRRDPYALIALMPSQRKGDDMRSDEERMDAIQGDLDEVQRDESRRAEQMWSLVMLVVTVQLIVSVILIAICVQP